MRLELQKEVGVWEDEDFNSIKVRLEPEDNSINSYLFDNFNSIKVRLELSRQSLQILVVAHFNSIKVRLEQ